MLPVVATTLFVASMLVALCPRFLRRRCLTIVALAALPALVHCHAIAFFIIIAFAFRLSESASTAATISIVAIVVTFVVILLTIRLIIVASRAIPELASCVARPARLALLGEVACKSFFRAIAQTIDLGTFERAINFFLRKKGLKIVCETFDCLGGQLFSAFDVLGAVCAVEHHVVPLQRQFFTRRWRLAGGEKLGDA